ncbi:MAG: hypothetical protein Q9190_007634, partial [Brigantiaea leucoxantha]
FFIRTLGDRELEVPKYRLNRVQIEAYRSVIRIVNRFSSFEEFEDSKSNRIEVESEVEPEPTSELESEPEFEVESEGIRYRKKPSIDLRLTDLEKSILDFSISLLDQKASNDEYELPLVNSLAFLGLTETGFRSFDTYPSILSSILQIGRFLVLRYAYQPYFDRLEKSGNRNRSRSSSSSSDFESFEDNDSKNSINRLKTLVDRFLINGSGSPIDWILNLRNYGLKAARTTTATGSIDWNQDTIIYGRISFSLPEFRSAIHGLLFSARTILFDDLFFRNPNRDIPSFSLANIFDNPIDSTSFSNFLDNPRTNLGIEEPERWIFDRISTNIDLSNRFTASRTPFSWNSNALIGYLSSIKTFLEKLSILFLLTGGQPIRAPELLNVRYSNSINSSNRNLFFENGLLVLVTYYSKGYTISNKLRIIHRYLPKEVSELVIYYLYLVLPFQFRIVFRVSKAPKTEYLFEVPTRSKASRSKASNITSDRFRTVFRRESQASLGIAINPSEYRHLAIGISKRYLQKLYRFDAEELEPEEEKDVDYEDDVIDLQAGHSSSTAGFVYGRGLLEADHEILSLKKRFREASI